MSYLLWSALVVIAGRGAPATAMVNKQWPLAECSGDCDTDSDCDQTVKNARGQSLQCYHRYQTEPVPGCLALGEGVYRNDYCSYRPENYLWYVGGAPHAPGSLGRCEGSCDDDDECEGDLVCHQRRDTSPVFGCEGVGRRASDYCSLDPELACKQLKDKKPEVIVVGAGMSGLAAAATLLKRGRSVVVLEGRGEVGGRMRTKTDFGVPRGEYYKGSIELGANWIYGGHRALNETGVPGPDGDGPVNPFKGWTLDADVRFMEELFNGKSIDMYDLTRPKLLRRLKFSQIQTQLAGVRTAARCVGAESVNDLYTKLGDDPDLARTALSMADRLASCGWNASSPIEQVLDAAWFENELLSESDDASELSQVPWGYEDFGGQILFITDQNGGLTKVAKTFAENNGVLPNHVIFDAKITNIQYAKSGSDEENVAVTVDLGDGKPCHVNAKKVISTVSPGVVDRTPNLFAPPIDPSKRQVDLRTWVKIFFQFPYAFWNGVVRTGPNPIDQFLYIFTGDEDNSDSISIWMNFDYEMNMTFAPERPEEYPENMASRFRVMPGCGILFAWMPQYVLNNFGAKTTPFNPEQWEDGNYILDLSTPETDDVERLLQPLKRAFPDNFEMPDHVYASSWATDEWTFGSWNSMKNGDFSNTDFYDFYSPKNENLWLSGASSCRRHYRNVHGAFFAGVRDGNWVADCIEQGGDACTHLGRPEGDCDFYEFPINKTTYPFYDLYSGY